MKKAFSSSNKSSQSLDTQKLQSFQSASGVNYSNAIRYGTAVYATTKQPKNSHYAYLFDVEGNVIWSFGNIKGKAVETKALAQQIAALTDWSIYRSLVGKYQWEIIKSILNLTDDPMASSINDLDPESPQGILDQTYNSILQAAADTRSQLRPTDVDRVMQDALEQGCLESFRQWILGYPAVNPHTKAAVRIWLPEEQPLWLTNWTTIKSQHPNNAIVLRRAGDFYEAYYEDARAVSEKLELTLTGKSVPSLSESVPMSGFPIHALHRYGAALTEAGLEVAIWDDDTKPEVTFYEHLTPPSFIPDRDPKLAGDRVCIQVPLRDCRQYNGISTAWVVRTWARKNAARGNLIDQQIWQGDAATPTAEVLILHDGKAELVVFEQTWLKIVPPQLYRKGDRVRILRHQDKSFSPLIGQTAIVVTEGCDHNGMFRADLENEKRSRYTFNIRWVEPVEETAVEQEVLNVEADPDTGAIVVCALRYCSGRRTYMPSLVIGWVKRHWEKIPVGFQRIILKDVQYSLEESHSTGSLGDPCDVQNWSEFYDWIKARLPEDSDPCCSSDSLSESSPI